jgi:hypothetical protein
MTIVGRRTSREVAMANGQQQLKLGQKVVTFAAGKQGRMVGRGECYDLADQALNQAGAKSAPDYGKVTDDADYEWGRRIELKDVEPGDILQIRDHKIVIRTDTTIKKVFANGGSEEFDKWNEQDFKRGHHTAIVNVNKGSGVLEVYEQNVKPGGKKVQRHTLYVRNQTPTTKTETRYEGKIRVTTTTTIKITVEGTVWAYRPEAR